MIVLFRLKGTILVFLYGGPRKKSLVVMMNYA